ncbi:RNA-directed DNA polymerase, eukaryota [Tanacetum coccineum]
MAAVATKIPRSRSEKGKGCPLAGGGVPNTELSPEKGENTQISRRKSGVRGGSAIKRVIDSWNGAPGDGSNAIRNFLCKLKFLKLRIRGWYADYRNNTKGVFVKFKEELRVMDEAIDKGDIVNEVQSAFIAERKILDGPFILNEVMQWCRMKKKQALIFKVDFEKAYDSVRWDFLDDVLYNFSFGNKWRVWIQSCLRSSRGSILINGSPTEEFQFFKGLKQGDPLSPFLFILIMESLHLSFQRVVDAGMFTEIRLSSMLNLSHLFYADDAIFLGQWSDTNIDTLVHVLECFHRASGLRINMCKSKIMGIYVDDGKIKNAASKLGCLILNTSFSYLGTKVGENMSRVHAWKEVVDKEVKVLQNQGVNIFDYIRLKLGNGDTTLFWEDKWCEGVVLKDMFPRIYALEMFKNSTGGISSAYCCMNHVWSLENSREFSVASIRKVIEEKRFPGVNSLTRWVKSVPIKVNIIAWKIITDALPTRFNISRRGIKIDSIACPICNDGVESTSHLFFQCSLVRQIAQKISSWWNVDHADVTSYEEWRTWMVSLRIQDSLKAVFEGVFYGLWWSIWIFRNKLLFEKEAPTQATIFDNIVSISFYWCKFRCKASFKWNDWLKNPYLVVV